MITHTRHLGSGRTLHHFRGKAGNLCILENQSDGATFLVDCGMPSDAPKLKQILKSMPPLKRVVCTHFHADHVAFLESESGVVICGDCMVVINGRMVLNTFLASRTDQAASLHRIKNTPGIRSGRGTAK